jgi:hypothetical protein
MRPFKVIFKTDANEMTTAVIGTATTAAINEQSAFPGGIIGFQLSFNQLSC